jgi:hypothetical protein
MHDFLIIPTDNVELDTIIELDFYFGCLANSLINVGQTVLTYLFNKLMYFDLNSKNILLNIMTYLKTDETVPNIEIAQELDKFYNSLNNSVFDQTNNLFQI